MYQQDTYHPYFTIIELQRVENGFDVTYKKARQEQASITLTMDELKEHFDDFHFNEKEYNWEDIENQTGKQSVEHLIIHYIEYYY